MKRRSKKMAPAAKPVPEKLRASYTEQCSKELANYVYGRGTGEDHVCKVFGCGRRLTKIELLFGNKCINHSKNKNDDTISTLFR